MLPDRPLDSSDQVVETRNANTLGGILFRNVTPGDGYKVRARAGYVALRRNGSR